MNGTPLRNDVRGPVDFAANAGAVELFEGDEFDESGVSACGYKQTYHAACC